MASGTAAPQAGSRGSWRRLGRSKWLPSLPVVILAVLLAVALVHQPSVTVESPALLTLLNFAFVTVAPLAAAGLAVSAYRRTGVVAVLALGTGMLVTGIGCGVLPAVVLVSSGANGTTTLHNASALFAAAFHFAAAIGGVLGISLGNRRGLHLAVAYAVAGGAVFAWLGLYALGATPVFWAPEGTTGIRLTVLLGGVLLYALSALLWWPTAVRDRGIAFLVWYIPGLALWAIALAAIALQVSLGGVVGWLARGAQYLGSLYMLAAVLLEAGRAPNRGGAGALGVSLLQAALPFRPLVESSSDAVILLGRTLRIVYWNEAAHQLFGHSTETVFDLDLVELLAPASADPQANERLRTMLRDVRAGGAGRAELRLTHRDGHAVPVEAAMFGNPDDDRLTVCVITDVSERVRARAILEQRVQERTAELELLNAELRSANAAKDEFLGLVSHELKTPITSIVAGAAILRPHVKGDTEDVLGDIAAEAGRLTRIVDNLLALARIERGTPVDHEPLLLDRVAAAATAVVRDRHPARQIHFKAERGVVVEGNEEQVAIVVTNLLVNAIKYSPDQEPVDISIEVDGPDAVLTVTDAGLGIDEDNLDDLFRPFHRGSAASSASGLGIGLTVCRRIAEAHGGSIGARSRRDGPGTVFWVRLPLAAEEALDLAPRNDAHGAEGDKAESAEPSRP